MAPRVPKIAEYYLTVLQHDQTSYGYFIQFEKKIKYYFGCFGFHG